MICRNCGQRLFRARSGVILHSDLATVRCDGRPLVVVKNSGAFYTPAHERAVPCVEDALRDLREVEEQLA